MSEQLFQIAAKALIRNDEGKIFMLHVPEWGHVVDHWDLPGGRMDPNETFLETLARELDEELGVKVKGAPIQLRGMLTNITIPVADTRVPLVYIIFEVELENIDAITLSNETREFEYDWLPPKEASKAMEFKFDKDFCQLVAKL